MSYLILSLEPIIIIKFQINNLTVILHDVKSLTAFLHHVLRFTVSDYFF